MNFNPSLAAGAVCLSLSPLALAQASRNDSSSTQTVVVTASPITEDGRLATIVESVDREEILRAGGTSLADALANTPGVTGTSFSAGASRPVIRGFDANRVRVLEDGIGSFDASDVGPDHGVPIDPLSAQRVEVIRGAATLRYGSQAIGGVINAINNRVPIRLPQDPFEIELSGLLGTNADTTQTSALLDARLGRFAIHADGFQRDSEDYDTPLGILPNTFSRGDGYSLGSSYFFGANRVGGAVVHYAADYGIPNEDSRIDMQQTKELLRSSFAPRLGAFHTLNVEGGYADYEHSECDPSGIALATFKDREWDARAEALFTAIGPFSAAALGVQMQQRDFSALGEAEDYMLPSSTKATAAFAFADVPFNERLHLHTGLRVEGVRIEGTPSSNVATSRRFTPVSGSAGLLVELSKAARLGLTVSSAARAPAQTELFARGPHEGPSAFETGDPSLGVERANSVEGTIRIHHEKAAFEGALWGARFDNYIFGNLTGRTCNEEGECQIGGEEELKELNYGQRSARFWGLEGKATVDVLETAGGALQAHGIADYVRAKLDNGSNVPRITPYRIGAGLEWASSQVDAELFVKYTGRQDDTAFGETPTSGFVSVDAHVAWRPFARHPSTELALVGRNLTDSEQRNAIALNKDEVPLPGREIRLLVRAKL